MSISVEDIGFGNLDAARHIYVLNQMRKEYAYDDPDQPMYFIHAIRILCASEKDRSSDFLKNIVIKTAAMGEVPEIIDLALDKHTKRGKAMGRDSKHFFNEALQGHPAGRGRQRLSGALRQDPGGIRSGQGRRRCVPVCDRPRIEPNEPENDPLFRPMTGPSKGGSLFYEKAKE